MVFFGVFFTSSTVFIPFSLSYISVYRIFQSFCSPFNFFFQSLLVACPSHTNPPSSGLGTGGIPFDKHIYESKQLYFLHDEA